jgi:hypothetical protein
VRSCITKAHPCLLLQVCVVQYRLVVLEFSKHGLIWLPAMSVLLPIAEAPVEVHTQDDTQIPEFGCPLKRQRSQCALTEIDSESSQDCSHDNWLVLLEGEDQGQERGPMCFFQPVREAAHVAEAPLMASGSSEDSAHAEEFGSDIHCLPFGHTVAYWRVECQAIKAIVFNLQATAADVLRRVVEVGKASDQFYCGITSWPRTRYVGGYTHSGNYIVGHLLAYESMELLFFCSRNQAARLERALIERVRQLELEGGFGTFANKSDGGESTSANSHNFWVYVAWNAARVPKVPDFTRWVPTEEA